MAEIILQVNNKNYTNWTSLSIHRNVEDYCGSFAFSSTDSLGVGYPIKKGDSVVVLVDGIKMVTGFVDSINATLSIDSHEITVRGRDNVCDLIDGDIPNDWKTAEGITNVKDFIELCEFVIKATGNTITVINSAGAIEPFGEDEIQEAESGQKAMDFLSNFARKRNLYLNTDGEGRLRIYRPANVGISENLVLLNRQSRSNNILARNYSTSGVDRFHTVTVRSQENGSTGLFDFEEADASGSAIDTDIRGGRILEIIAEEEMTADECEERAKEEINIRRARSVEYTCQVAGATQSDGTPWNYGVIVNLVDDVAEISGSFFVKSATITRTIERGTLTSLTLVSPDAYRVKGELTIQDKRKTNFGKKYNQ